MDKNSFGKGAGIGAAIAAIIAIICQITHNGAMPWIVLIAFILKKYTVQNVGMFIISKALVQAFVNVMSLNKMNKNFLKLPSEHFWILTKREKSQLLTELKRRVEVLS